MTSEGAVVHVEHTAPRDALGVKLQRIVEHDRRVDGRREQVVGRGHGVEIPGEVQVDLVAR